MRVLTTSIALAALPIASFSDPLPDTAAPTNALASASTGWLGKTSCPGIMGGAHDHGSNIQFMDKETTNIHALQVKREYLLTEGDYYPYRQVDFDVQMTRDGIAKNIEVKLAPAPLVTADGRNRRSASNVRLISFAGLTAVTGAV